MKRNQKPFSVEIKKSRVQSLSSQLPPRRLFETRPSDVTQVLQKEEPQSVAEPSPAPRILPSIVESVWSGSEPVEPIRHKRSSVETNRGQMELDLTARASEDVQHALARAQATADAVTPTDVTPVIAEDAAPVHDVQFAQGESVKAKSRKPRKKGSQAVEPALAFLPMPEAEGTPEPAVIAPPAATSKVVQRRLTKRLAAAAQLPRNERWKRRLHPTSW
jgi:hypothetical protein